MKQVPGDTVCSSTSSHLGLLRHLELAVVSLNEDSEFVFIVAKLGEPTGNAVEVVAQAGIHRRHKERNSRSGTGLINAPVTLKYALKYADLGLVAG